GLAGATCDGQPVLTLAVAPDFAPVVELAAKDLGGASSGCKPVAVTAQEPALTLRDLSSRPPDAWIPSSSAWLRLASARAAARGAAPPGAVSPGAAPPDAASAHASSGGPASGRTGGTSPAAPAWSIFADNPVSLARSPVVVAAPRPFAESLGWPGKQPGWAD